jgi:putative tryptophan/tyrosine transport system substrate-binding protein
MRSRLNAVHSSWSVARCLGRWSSYWLVLVIIVLSLCSIAIAHEKHGFVVLPNSAPHFLGPVGGEENTADILATDAQTGGTFGVWRYTSILPDGPPLHIHRAEDEFFYVVKGEFDFQLGDCITRAPARSFVFIPKDTVHTFLHVGEGPGVLLGTVHPGGFEGLFQELPGADLERLKALFKKYHMDVVGPPLKAVSHPPIPAADAHSSARVFRIGVLSPGCNPPTASLDLLVQGLRDSGYVEGQNLAIEWRYSEGRPERFPEMAAELAHLPVDLIVAVSTPAALAAKAATQTVPIVMIYVADPVGTGLITSLSRPGGNITGVSDMATDLSGKRLELLREAVPKLSHVAVLWNAADPGMVLRFREIQAAAQTLGVALQSVEVRSPLDFDRAFTAIAKEPPDALFVVAEALTLAHRCQVLDFAAEHRLPAMYEFGVFAREGGLMAYGPKLTDTFQRGAYFVDRILKAAKPADLPVEQPMKFELVINFKTAEALGLRLPAHLVTLADHEDFDRESGCSRLW